MDEKTRERLDKLKTEVSYSYNPPNPTPEAIEKLRSIITDQIQKGDIEIIWGPELDFTDKPKKEEK